MTTIILTVIGILLAAAAALMIIFYGGDAFNQGAVGAQANQLQNAGTNVLTAGQMASFDRVSFDTNGVADLVTADYLSEAPALDGIASAGISYDATNEVFTAEIDNDDAAEVCAKVNKNLSVETTATAIGATKMGCFSDGADPEVHTFYATL